ncbi:uncharacterized protein A1O9_09185 [Exophiala aquamarina CBS 119918]|uniref:Uncharacterized protein n=1 Tax=Exophiala aquamarina CBS 119918 TaxID=1182545 RepID=A0A072P643_9EURO|nr:uncharacterized protein A1O9_09185 [Exophiala aquamarina CBS 119918]KEF54743.1 hypothetical protein A1O9_09185 [Exophiala aquamarina CBS 119918]
MPKILWRPDLHEDLKPMKSIKECIKLPYFALRWGEPYCQDILYLLSLLLSESRKLHVFDRYCSSQRSTMDLSTIEYHRQCNIEVARAAEEHALGMLGNDELKMIQAAATLTQMRRPMPVGLAVNLIEVPPFLPPSPKRKRADGDEADGGAARPHKRQRTSETENELVTRDGGIAWEEKAEEEKPADTEGSSNPGSKKTANTRSSKGDAAIKMEEDQILHNIRETLTARSKEKADYDAFWDAICPDNGSSVDLPLFTEEDEEGMKKGSSKGATKPVKAAVPAKLGDPGDLHASEIVLCNRIGLDYGSYRCQKRRIFLAIAICTEFYSRRLEQQPTFRARTIGVSQGQVFCNIDVNITSSMMRAFMFWGWVPPIVYKDPDRKGCVVVSREYLDHFPREHRLGLLREVAVWEEQMKKPSAARKALG